MTESQNVEVVKAAYAAFGSGDIPALLALLAADVEWHGVYGTGPHVPTSGRRRGMAAVDAFFGQVAEHVHFWTFEPKEFIATGDKVVALGHYRATTSQGGEFDSDFAMVFTVKHGKVTRFQEFCDGAAISAAYIPVAVPAR